MKLPAGTGEASDQKKQTHETQHRADNNTNKKK